MTVSATNVKEVYDGNDLATEFSFSFPCLDEDHIEVTITDSDGVEEVLASNYTVDLVDQTVTYPNSGSPLATGYSITIRRVLPLTQGLDLSNQGALSAENLEQAYDKLVMIAQQLDEGIDRAILFPVSSNQSGIHVPEPEADKFLKWNADGTGLENNSGTSSNAGETSSTAAGIITEVTVQTVIDYMAPKVTGTRASPTAIVAGTGIAPTNTTVEETIFIQGSGGAVDVSANPQIAAGTRVGQKLRLIARSDTNTVLLEDGTGLSLNGPWTGGADSVLVLYWDGTNWTEESRR